MVMPTGFLKLRGSVDHICYWLAWIFLVGSFSVLTFQPLSADKPAGPREVVLNKYGIIENLWPLPPLALFAPAKRSLCLIRLGV